MPIMKKFRSKKFSHLKHLVYFCALIRKQKVFK